MKQALHLTVAFALALYGCAGSAPNPVLSYQPGDEKRSCQGLRAEIASNEAETIRLASEKGEKLGYNVALGVAGAFLLVPWFFMDVKGKETGELNALRHRNRTLPAVRRRQGLLCARIQGEIRGKQATKRERGRKIPSVKSLNYSALGIFTHSDIAEEYPDP